MTLVDWFKYIKMLIHGQMAAGQMRAIICTTIHPYLQAQGGRNFAAISRRCDSMVSVSSCGYCPIYYWSCFLDLFRNGSLMHHVL